MFELEPSKIDGENWPWLLIISIVIMLCGIGSTLADPTTAPLNNIVRIHIDSIKGSCGTGFIFGKGRILTAKHDYNTDDQKPWPIFPVNFTWFQFKHLDPL